MTQLPVLVDFAPIQTSDEAQVDVSRVGDGTFTIATKPGVTRASEFRERFWTCSPDNTITAYRISSMSNGKHVRKHTLSGIDVTCFDVFEAKRMELLVVGHRNGILCVSTQTNKHIGSINVDGGVCALAVDCAGPYVYFLTGTRLCKWQLGTSEYTHLDEAVNLICPADNGVMYVKQDNLVHYHGSSEPLVGLFPNTFAVKRVLDKFVLALSLDPAGKDVVATVVDVETRKHVSRSVKGVTTGAEGEKVLVAASCNSGFIFIGSNKNSDVQLLRFGSLEMFEQLELEDCYRMCCAANLADGQFYKPVAFTLVVVHASGPHLIVEYEGSVFDVWKLSSLPACKYAIDKEVRIPQGSVNWTPECMFQSEVKSQSGEGQNDESSEYSYEDVDDMSDGEIEKARLPNVTITKDGIRLPFWEDEDASFESYSCYSDDEDYFPGPAPIVCTGDFNYIPIRTVTPDYKVCVCGIKGYDGPVTTRERAVGQISALTLTFRAKMRTSYYRIEAVHLSISEFPRRWVLEGYSPVTSSWVVIDKRENVSAFTNENRAVVFKVQRIVDATSLRLMGRNLAIKRFEPMGLLLEERPSLSPGGGFAKGFVEGLVKGFKI